MCPAGCVSKACEGCRRIWVYGQDGAVRSANGLDCAADAMKYPWVYLPKSRSPDLGSDLELSCWLCLYPR